MPTKKTITTKPFIQGDDQYRNLIDNMKLGLLEVDLEGFVQYVNDSFCRMTEYQQEDLVGKKASEILVSKGSLSDKLVEEHSASRKEGNHSVYEVQITKKNGLRIWVLIGGGPLYNKDGEVIGSIGIHHDFTEKKQNEESLKKLVRELAIKNREFLQQQEFLKAINEFSTVVADQEVIHDLASVITENIVQRFGFEDCVIYVLDEEDYLKQASAFGPKKDDYGGIKNPIKIKIGEGIVGTVAKTGVAEIIGDTTLDDRYIMDDQLRLSEITVPIIYDGKVLGIIDAEHPQKNYFTQEHLETLTTIANLTATKLRSAIVRDNQQKIQSELEESESKFRNIINSALDAVIMINSKGLVTEWNEKAEEIFEFTSQETLGKRLSELIIPQQYKASHEKGMKNFLKTGEGPVLNNRIEITAVGKKREEFPIELSISPIKVNEEYFFSAFARDISEQKANQKKIEKALEQERELNELKMKFVSMASHEFRTPLTTIKVNTDLLNHRLENTEGVNSAVFKNLGRIDNEVERLRKLMNDVLTIGRIEAGRIEVNLQKANLVYLVNKVIKESFNHQKDGRKVAVSVYGKEKDVKVDGPIFEHIVTNLISNAFKYSEGKDEPEVNMDFRQEEVILTVKDHGIGIPKNDLESIFDTFYRASNVGNIQGSGVGLAIVNQFVKLHHGTMDLKSKEGKGTTISVKIPYALN